jgi:glycosyltransferase involved in cell wall biosynthesis
MQEREKTKVVLVIAESGLGGGPSHVLGLLRHLDQSKFRLFLICPKGDLAEEAKKSGGVTVVNLSMRSKFDWQAGLRLREEIRKIQALDDPFGPMVVHSHGTRAGLFCALYPARDGVRFVYTEHRWNSDYRLKNPLNNWLQKIFLVKIYRQQDLIIGVSRSVRDFVVGNGISPEKVKIVPNAIEEEQGTRNKVQIKKVREANRAPVIGTIGNLNFQKGQSYLIDAMAEVVRQYPLATLEIIGEGAERQNHESRIKNHGLEKNIALMGKQKDVYKHMNHWDLFVLPSVAETFGIVLLEAMSAGLPIIATKIGGVVDIVENGKTAILVKAKDPSALAKAITRLLSDSAKMAALKRAGSQRVKDFAWDKIVLRIEEVYLSKS